MILCQNIMNSLFKACMKAKVLGVVIIPTNIWDDGILVKYVLLR